MSKLLRLAQDIDRQLRAIRQQMRRPVESEFAKGGLTGPQRSVMQVLVRSDAMSLKDLSKAVGLAHSTVSVIVSRLQQRGLIAREVDTSDRRTSKIMPSAAVREFIRDTLPRLEIHPLLDALQKTKPQDRAKIVKGLEILSRALDR